MIYSKIEKFINKQNNEIITISNNKDKIKKQIKELLSGKDCSKYNWISIHDYHNYKLSEPEEIHINNLTIYNEGKFIKNI